MWQQDQHTAIHLVHREARKSKEELPDSLLIPKASDGSVETKLEHAESVLHASDIYAPGLVGTMGVGEQALRCIYLLKFAFLQHEFHGEDTVHVDEDSGVLAVRG